MNEKIIEIINGCGIRDVGFCSFDTVNGHLLNCRAAARLPENASSIILCLFPYKIKEKRPENISRYAAVPDYHPIGTAYLCRAAELLKKEYPQNKFEVFIDNSPIPEVYAAAAAGLGVIGENGLLINKKYGSWCFIGEIVTDLKLDCKNEPKKCPMCGDCKKACPTGGHGAECLSAVSQQKKPLTETQISALKANNIVWGCDICAEVCPLNSSAETSYIKEFIKGYRNSYQDGEDITNRAYCWRGEKVIQRNFHLKDM